MPDRADNPDDLRLTVAIRADAASIWNAITLDDQRRRWWPYLELQARAGGDVVERWHDADGREQWTRGQVLDMEPHRRLRCSWRDDGWPAATQVEIALGDGDEDGSTQVALRHSGWQQLADGAALRAAHLQGWSMHLAHLKAFVEGRPPL